MENCLPDQRIMESMSKMLQKPLSMRPLRDAFGEHLQENVTLANYTNVHIGGLVDALLIVHSADEMASAISKLWKLDVPYYILGSGTNVLVSEAGLHAVVVVNRAHNVRIDTHSDPPSVWAESGASLAGVVHQVGLRGLSGLEWAASLPGTVGGAVYGNAGAFGGEMSHNLIVADILHRESGRSLWQVERLEYGYRTSILKGTPCQAIILAARLRLSQGVREDVLARMQDVNERRRRKQPLTGASMGSMFKNPPGEYAGRLIEAAGLKGKRIGNVEISPVHANIFINHGQATADDVLALINLARNTVKERFGIELELEIEFLGDWTGKDLPMKSLKV